MTSIFVAKLDFNTTEEELKSLFEEHGKVNRVTIAKDRETGKPRGFAFVEMPNEAEADAAIDALDETSVNGRTIAVKKADDRGKSGGDRPAHRQDRPRDENRSNDFKRTEERVSRPIISPEDILPLKPERKKEKEVFPKKALVKPDTPKKPKMEAYKKSGKNNRFFDEDDEEDLDWELNNRRTSSGWDDDDEEE